MKIVTQKYTLLILLAFSAFCQAQFITNDAKNNIIKPIAAYDYTGPNSITRNIKQDKKGNIWFASWGGVFKYDGNSFINMTSKVSLSHFFSVLEDSKGNLWFGSIGSGVYYYDGDSFRNFTTKDGLANDSVIDIYEDESGNIWFASQGGVSYYDWKSFTNFTSKDGLPHDDINAIIEDKTGTFWMATRGAMSIYDRKTFTNFTNKDGRTFNNVRSIIEDKNGVIWFGGNDGLWRYDGQSLTNLTTAFVGYIYEDKKGSIWTSSQGGQGWEVTRYDKNPLFQENFTTTQIWTDDDMFFGILEDNKGGTWFGSLNGACHYDGNTVNCLNAMN